MAENKVKLKPREKSERDFNDWIESIYLVDPEKGALEPELTDDKSDDPEEDRG